VKDYSFTLDKLTSRHKITFVNNMKAFPPEVIEALKSYVYLYVDPRNGRPFYVGKGVGSRAFAHLADADESEKVERIAAIRSSGKEPRVEILRHGLTDDQAALVEAAVIDCIGLDRLTNAVSGHHSRSFGRVSVEDVLLAQTAPKADILEASMLITINRLYRSGMTPVELYEATRGIWKVGRRREKAEFAMAVFQGVIREVYRIKRWHPAGTLPYVTRDAEEFSESGRWEFEGRVATEQSNRYVRTSIRHLLKGSNQNPIRYVKC
jgi:uncharacterized protein